jgi:aminoglycoside phosphotransferase (APT) family kinase protein
VAYPSAAVLTWAATVLKGEVTVDRGLRNGGSPWLIRAAGRSAVLRVAPQEYAANVATEVAAMRHAAAAGLPVPEVLGHDDVAAAGFALALTSQLPGSSRIPAEPDATRLRALGAVAARISAIDLAPSPVLPPRSGPIGDVDWSGLRREHGAAAVLRQAEAAVHRARRSDDRAAFVHGDLWHGNTLWDATGLTAILDWDAAGVGPTGIDLGSLRCDAALCYGMVASAEVLRGWEDEAGRPASDVAYWDAVAALATPPDMGRVQPAIAGQGRPDLTRELLTERRQAFLEQALSQLGR